MRRKLLIAALSLSGLILILVIGVFIYIRSGRLDLYLQGQIITALKTMGVRAEIGDTKLDIRGNKVTLKDITLYAGDGKEPFGKVGSLETVFSIVSYLKQEINITSVKVVSPIVWIEYDEQGRLNLEALHAPPKTEEKRTITFLTANVEVTGGEVNFSDRARNINANLPGLTIGFNPREPAALEDKINHTLTVASGQGTAFYEGRKVEKLAAYLKADVMEQGQTADTKDVNAKVWEFKLDSDLGEVTGKDGAVESFFPFKYRFPNLEAGVSLAQIARVFTPDTQMSGSAKFTGKVEGTGADYQAEGRVETGELMAEGFRIAGLDVQTNVTGSGSQYKATADVTSGAVSGRDLTISSIRLSDASIKGQNADFDLAGRLVLDSLKSGRISVSGLRGSLYADRERVSLSDFSASALGGSLSGTASVAYAGGSSLVDVQFRSVDLGQAASLAAAKNVRVRGNASGGVKIAFPGLDYRAASGRLNATFDAAISSPDSPDSAAPAKGEVSLVATGRGFNIERASVRSAASEVTATGTVGWNGAGNLSVNFKSEDMAEVQRVVDAFGLIPEDVKEKYGIGLAGPGEFVGRVEGRLSAPTVTGHLKLSSIAMREDETGPDVSDADKKQVGSFEGDIAYSPSLLRVEKASLVRPDGSRADFDLRAPLDGKNNIALKANVQNFDLPTIVRVASPEFADFIGRGVVNGTIDLRGLPGPKTIEGTADLTLNAGEFNVPAEEGKDPKRIDVPEFAGNIKIANSVLSVENLRMQIGDSQLMGQGSFNLDTYAYSINAEGKNFDLAQISEAASDKVRLSGRADVTVTGQGNWDDWSSINVNATVQGRNVILNGRELGDAKLVAFTENGLLKLEATGNVLEQSRTLTATIDLRDRKNYPVNANIEFTDTDLGPYLGLISPELSGISGRATGTITLSGPLQEPDQVQAVANLTKLELGGALIEGRRYTITNEGSIVVTASPREVTLNRVTFTGEGTRISLEGTISREGGARSSLVIDGEINLRFLSSFTQTVFTTGIAQVQASIVGSLESPQLLGSVNLRDVGVRVVNVPISIARGNGQIRFTASQALIENFTAATPGGGTITLTGGAALSGLAPDRWRIEGNADQVGVEFPRDTQSVFDASFALQGNRRVQVLSGDVDVRRAAYTKDITLEELLRSGGPFGPEFVDIGPGGGGAGAGPPITLNLRITADNTLTVRNNLAEALGSAFLNVQGPISDPVVSGRVLLSQGRLEFRNDRYELTRGLITFPGKRRADPILDIQSEADIGGYRITISFSGTLAKLETTLRSDPELPERDIVSLVLTGSIAGDRSTAAAATQSGLGLAQSILSASLSEQLQKGTQRLFGLSRFSIDPLIVGRGNDPTARVTLGQRINRNLTITYSQNLTSGSSGLDRIVLIEYRISNRFSLIGFRNERGELGFDVRVRKRF